MNEAVVAPHLDFRHVIQVAGSLQTRLVGVAGEEQNGNALAAGCAQIHRLLDGGWGWFRRRSASPSICKFIELAALHIGRG
jgi:hypothetical protein